MSKERLESLKRNKEWTEATGEKFYTVDKEDIEWLIEQAERVQDLEEERDEWKDTSQSYYMTNQELRERNKRYRKALEEIAQKRMTYADMAGALRIANKALEDENMENIDKRIIDKGFHTGYEVDFVTIQQSDYEYLKEQAERVQELEDKLARIRFVNNDYDKQNKRYREALEQISQKRMTYADMAGVLRIARKALEGEE